MDYNKILIIPAAAYAEINEQFIPEIFKINDTGRMNIISNMIDLPLSDFDKIYIVFYLNLIILFPYHLIQIYQIL